MKFRYALLAGLSFILFIGSTYAKELYTNKYGVIFTKDEYDFITELYWDGYQDYMTAEDFDYVISEKYLDKKVEKYNYNIIPMDASHQTSTKKISLSKVCDDDCLMVTSVKWFNEPNVKSYDVIGANLGSSAFLVSVPNTKIISNSTSFNETNNIKYDISGFGVSFKLPGDSSNLNITQTYKITGSGTIYASYQHAKKSTTLANSQKYSFSTAGYGHVFLFDSSVKGNYDGMAGVSVTI